MLERSNSSSRRLPGLPERTEVPVEELEDYEFMLERIRGSESGRMGAAGKEPYALPYLRSMTVSPRLAAAFSRLGIVGMRLRGGEGTLSEADHEMVDMVLCFDSGYWFLLAGHLPLAITAGVRIEALEALRDGREGDLSPDERQQVEFIRAVRDLAMTDEIWTRMVDRLGSVRGAVEYAYLVCLVQFAHVLASALGVPSIGKDDVDRMLQEFKDGAREPPSYDDYAALFGLTSFGAEGSR